VPGACSGQVTVSLIIPTLNDPKNLAHMLPALPDVIDELVIVDGGSTVSADG
jgi:glycosyltransferase involved in cell wall biosynthesis